MNRYTVVDDETDLACGAAVVEYVLLFSLIVLVCLASLTAFGAGVGSRSDDSASRIVSAGGGQYGD